MSAALAALSLGLPGQPPGQKAGVLAAPAVRFRFVERVPVLGAVESPRMVEPSAEVEGLVASMAVKEGDPVAEGDPLLELDTTLRKIALRQAEAELEAARAQLEEYQSGTRPEEIAKAREAAAGAQAELEEAERDLQRVEELWRKAMASERDFTGARAKAQVARHLLAQSKAALALAVAGPRAEMIQRARAQVALAQAGVDKIAEELRRAVVRAPFAGVVTARRVEKGGYVRPGEPLLVLVQVDPIRVELSVPEAIVDRVRRGMELSMTFDSIPGERFPGRVQAVVPEGDGKSRLFPVKVALENPGGRLLPGMAARAVIELPAAEPSLAVPIEALVRTETGTHVFAVREGRAVLVPVAAGAVQEGLVAVHGGLEEGESVVVRGNERLQPGASVEVSAAPAGGGRRQ